MAPSPRDFLVALSLCLAAGREVSTEDSVNLLPYLTGEAAELPRRHLLWRSGPTQAVRDDRFKLIRYKKTKFRPADLGPDGRLRPPEGGWPTDAPQGHLTLLYDLEEDPGESNNLADTHPEIVARLQGVLDDWLPQLVEPFQPPIRSTITEIEGEWVQLLF